jgi:diaminopimelate decarboxylase
MSDDFQRRLFPVLEEIAAHFGTPFHIYDEVGIRATGQALIEAFGGIPGFQEFFAVKALPNPRIMQIMQSMGFGFDCSSISELALGRRIGARGEKLMFTSNNTSQSEFAFAERDGGCILNLDDISLIKKLAVMPEMISMRYNPGELRSGNSIIGNPVESKYGISGDQLVDAYRMVRDKGAQRFGLHTMLASNELNHHYMIETAGMLLDGVEKISHALGIPFEFINIGGGLGIPYKPGQPPLNLKAMAEAITAKFGAFRERNGYAPRLYMESGRYMTGPHGVLVVRAINRKEIYRTYIGVDASMSALMRPGIYGAYHHIDVLGKATCDDMETVDVVGSLCENNDKFAIQRLLPPIVDGDILCMHDTGAHGHAMGFNYNGKLRPKEVLLKMDGTVELIRREERMDDYFATLAFEPDCYTVSTSPAYNGLRN